MNYFYQIDYSHYIINGVVQEASKITLPLGNWNNSAKDIEQVENNMIQCYLRKQDGSWEKNELLFNLQHIYENENGNFVEKELNSLRSLPNGDWITSIKNFHSIVPTSSSGNGKILCELKTKYGYVNNDLNYDISKMYLNSNGHFICLDYNLYHSMKNMDPIPKKIFQTHRSIEYVLNKQKLKFGYDSWIKYKDFEYFFYNDLECEKFIQENFDAKTLKAYNKCPIAVMKADLWRYCVIYIHGGIYADMDAVLMVDPAIFLQSQSYLVFSPETDNRHLCQWTFSAPPKSPVLKTIIDLSVERILDCNDIRGNYIIHTLTGPKVFTDGIELYLKTNNLPMYKQKIFYENYQNCILHCFVANYFHNKMIRHLFAGSDKDGWKLERDNCLI